MNPPEALRELMRFYRLSTSAEAGPVALTVHTATGQEIARLVDGLLPAGEHAVTWRRARASSGTYIYRLRTNEQVFVGKMILAK